MGYGKQHLSALSGAKGFSTSCDHTLSFTVQGSSAVATAASEVIFDWILLIMGLSINPITWGINQSSTLHRIRYREVGVWKAILQARSSRNARQADAA